MEKICAAAVKNKTPDNYIQGVSTQIEEWKVLKP